MNLYTRARKHINMSRVKELREENKEKQKIAEAQNLAELKQQIEVEEAYHHNWRRDLKEGMTTSGLSLINLQPNITELGPGDDKTRDIFPGVTPDGTLDSNGVWTMNNAPDAGNSGITISLLLDLSRSNTFSTAVHFNNATVDPAHGMDVVFNKLGTSLEHIVPLSVPGSGTGLVEKFITIPSEFRIKDVVVSYSVIGNGGSGKEIGNNAIKITSAVPFRSTPMNVFVSLDDPEATAFVRSTLSNENLSPEQKKKKLNQMLAASAEYLTKMFGEGIFTGATEISDVELQQSFAQIAANQVDYGTDLTPLSDNPYGTEIAQVASVDLMNLGIDATTATVSAIATALGIGYNAAVNLKNSIMQMQGGYPDYGADAGPTTTGQPLPGVGENTPGQQAEIDAANQEISDARQALNDAEDSGNQTAIDMARERLNRANNNRTRLRQRNRNQRNLPGYQGESVIHEKKKLKSPASLLDKIPGYYDGKPAPLGFPIEEPPKMVNGKHPDLVDGKKISQRYNRLDPISAKAMPKTGNKHIDSKVAKARSKAK